MKYKDNNVKKKKKKIISNTAKFEMGHRLF